MPLMVVLLIGPIVSAIWLAIILSRKEEQL